LFHLLFNIELGDANASLEIKMAIAYR